jgi:hypothetical protein
MLKRTSFVLMAMAGVAMTTGPAAAATEVARYTFSGAQASVTFVATTSLTCPGSIGGYAMAIGYLQGAEQIYSSGSSNSGTYVQIEGYYNSCTGTSFAGTGSISGGFTAPDKKMTSARLAGSGTVQNFGDGSTLPVSLDVQIVGVGNTTNSKSNSHSKVTGTKQGPVYITHDHSANSNRAGEAFGSITIDGVTFDDIQTYYGSLNANGSSSASISK